MRVGRREKGSKWVHTHTSAGRRCRRSDNVARRREDRQFDQDADLHDGGCPGCGDTWYDMLGAARKGGNCSCCCELYGEVCRIMYRCDRDGCEVPTAIGERFCSDHCERHSKRERTWWQIWGDLQRLQTGECDYAKWRGWRFSVEGVYPCACRNCKAFRAALEE